MKITGKISKLNPLLGLYIAAGLLIAAIPVRLYQHLTIIEQDTGFYKAVDRSVYVMYILAALALCFSYAVAVLAKNVPASKSPYRKNIILALTSILLGVGIVLDVVSAMSDFIINARSFATAGISFLGTADQGQIPILFESVLGVFAAIYLLVFGISYIDGRTTYSQYKFLAVTPFFWAIARLVGRLITKIAYVNVSDLMLEIFGIAFMMIFFMAFARISSGLSTKKAMRNAFASGAASAFLLGAANIPRLLLLISGNAYKITSGYGVSVCDLVFVFFAAAYIINAYKCAKENDSKELLNEYEKHDVDIDMETDDDFLSE